MCHSNLKKTFFRAISKIKISVNWDLVSCLDCKIIYFVYDSIVIALFITHLHGIEKHTLTISLTIVHIYNPYTGQTLCSKPANLNHERGREKFRNRKKLYSYLISEWVTRLRVLVFLSTWIAFLNDWILKLCIWEYEFSIYVR